MLKSKQMLAHRQATSETQIQTQTQMKMKMKMKLKLKHHDYYYWLALHCIALQADTQHSTHRNENNASETEMETETKCEAGWRGQLAHVKSVCRYLDWDRTSAWCVVGVAALESAEVTFVVNGFW